jgi:hypothetical protein
VEVIKTDDATYTFTMPAGDVTVTAVFGQLYTVTISELDNGSIELGKPSAAEGETVTLTVTPAGNFRLKAGSLKVNDGVVTVSGDGPYTFTMPASNVTVTAQFEQLYTVTISGGFTNGSIGTNKPSAAEGETVTLTASPSAGYKLESITVTRSGNVEVSTDGTGNSRTFTMPADNVTVTGAVFTELAEGNYTINYATLEGGTVSGNTSAQKGAAVMVFAYPDTNYHYVPSSIVVKKTGTDEQVYVTNFENSGGFDMPASNVTVTAQFVYARFSIVKDDGIIGGKIDTISLSREAGTVVELTVTPDNGYKYKEGSIIVAKSGGGVVNVSGSGNNYTFKMPYEDVTVTAEFEEEEILVLSAGLYQEGSNTPETLTGEGTLIAKALAWIKKSGASMNGKYTILLDTNETETANGYFIGTYNNSSGSNSHTGNKRNLSITLKGIGEGVTITKGAATGSLFTLYGYVSSSDVPNLILENITLAGYAENTSPLVSIGVDYSLSARKGTLTMKAGSKITGNGGGGVILTNSSEFTMQGGTISGNSAAKGAAVYTTNSTFTKTGGIIYGKQETDGNANTPTGSGHVIETSGGQYRDSTADENMNTTSEWFWEN